MLAQSLLGLLVLFSTRVTAGAQDLVPNAYTPAPPGVTIVTTGFSFSHGGVAFDPAVQVDEANAKIGAAFFGVNRTLNIAGRSASVGVGLPYFAGHFQGKLAGQFEEVTRSGLGDVATRVAVNLYGGPAMTAKDFATFRPKTLVGASVTVGAPSGVYDNGHIINIGTNRWTVKPELGLSQKRGKWTVEGDIGGSFFTDNTDYLRGGTRLQAPIVSFQGHLIYTRRPGLWLAGDGNFWKGGRVTVNGVAAGEEQRNSRLGLTLAAPIGRQQIRIAYSFGAYTRLGGDFSSIGVTYSYLWR